jgi:glycosyltransferase involved in cell wall biosynthesis
VSLNNNKDVIALVLRSNDVDPEPRTQKAIQDLETLGYTVILFKWMRDSSVFLQSKINKSKTIFYLNAPYGGRFHNLWKQILWQIWLLKNILTTKSDLIYACDADTALIGLLAARIKKLNLIYDQFDPISSRFSNKVLIKISRRVEYFLCSHADLSIVPSQNRVMNGVRNQIISSNFPFEKAYQKSKIKTGLLKISYFGVLQADRGINTLVEAFLSLDKVELTIAGYGPLGDSISKIQSTQFTFAGKVNHPRGLKILSESDVSCVFYDPEKEHNRLNASSKFIESLVSGTPCITNDGTSLAEIIHDFELGWVVPYGDTRKLTELLSTLSSMDGYLIKNFEDNRARYFQKIDVFAERAALLSKLAEFKERKIS